MNIRLLLILVPLALVFCHQAHAQENSGFLKDYSVFTRTSEEGEVLLYIRDGAVERLAQYDSIMVDQPELFIDPDSNYKGMKPDTVTDIGEMIRSSVVDGLSGAYGIVEEPGESTLYLRLAATNLYIRKDKRGILGYTPIGAVAHGVKNASSEFVEKNTLVEMALEVELQDSTTGEVMAAAILARGQRKDKKKDIEEEAADWDRLAFAFTSLGKRLACRLNNTRVAESKRVNCLSIPVQPPEDESEE